MKAPNKKRVKPTLHKRWSLTTKPNRFEGFGLRVDDVHTISQKNTNGILKMKLLTNTQIITCIVK